MSTTIKLPQQFDLTALNRFTRGIMSNRDRPNDSVFTLDFKPLNFIDGSGYTVLSNTLQWLYAHHVTVHLINYRQLLRPGIVYLDDCGFFAEHTGKSLRPSALCRNTTLPCSSVEHAAAHGWLEFTLSPWLSEVLNVSHGALGSVRTCIKELFNNISDHSTLQTGFIHVQHYPGQRTVKITVSDFGRGIPASIKGVFGEMADHQAILLASREGITSGSTPTNRGLGLSFLVDSIAGNGGQVSIHSRSGSLYCFRDRDGTVGRRAQAGNGAYPGTLIDITLDTRLFKGDPDDRINVEW